MPSELLPDSGITVLWAPLTSAERSLLELLDDRERQRYRAFAADADRGRFLVGAALFRVAAGGLLGVPPTDVVVDRRCPECSRWHGRPTVGDAEFDLAVTHSGVLIALAAIRAGRVGIDAERIGDRDPTRVDTWCRQEARFKCGPGARSTKTFAGPLPGYRLAVATDRRGQAVRIRSARAELARAAAMGTPAQSQASLR